MTTSPHSVPYYVENASTFTTKYPIRSRDRARLEAAIEKDWREAMQQHCYNERMLQQRYRYYGHNAKADGMELRSCKALDERFNPHPAGGAAAGQTSDQPAAAAA
jgi:hypothetical protein